MKTLQQLFEIAGIKDIDKAMAILNEDDFHTILYKIDKWMPSDLSIQDEYDDLVSKKHKSSADVEDLAALLYREADEEVLKKYGFSGNWKALANYIITNK